MLSKLTVEWQLQTGHNTITPSATYMSTNPLLSDVGFEHTRVGLLWVAVVHNLCTGEGGSYVQGEGHTYRGRGWVIREEVKQAYKRVRTNCNTCSNVC